MGTYMTDYEEVDFLTGADLATDGTDTGDVVSNIPWARDVTFVLTTGTVAGANTVTIEGCETSDFSTADVVTYGTFNLVAGDDDDTKEMTTYINSRYLRAKVVIGTSGDLSATTLFARPKHWMRTRLNSTTDLL